MVLGCMKEKPRNKQVDKQCSPVVSASVLALKYCFDDL